MAWSVAAVVDHLPAVEPLFLAAGRAAGRFRAWRVFHGRTASALAARWTARGAQHRRIRVAGYPLVLDVSEFYAHDHYFAGVPFEPGLTQFAARWLRTGDTFVDIGANHGYFSLLAASIVAGTGTVVAFEPEPGARMKLAAALARNGLTDRVEVVPVALSNRNGAATLHQAHHSSLATLVPDQSPVRRGLTFGGAVEVETVRLDDWNRRRDLPPIRLIKIDVEGAEALVVGGMPGMLASGSVDALVVETQPGSEADRLLIAAGFSADTLDEYPDGTANRRYVRRTLTRC